MTDCKFVCEKCSYKTNIKSHYDKHLTSKKHLFVAEEMTEDEMTENPFECDVCKKRFKTNSGLWKHNKLCNEETNISRCENTHCENTQSYNNTTTTTTNSHNTTNINIFLNEHCKEAINLDEFIEKLKFKITDLDPIYDDKNNYIASIVQIVLKNLYDCSLLKRPIHCINDCGGSTIHFKEENTWKKEDCAKKIPRLNEFVNKLINQNVAKYNRMVGLKYTNRIRFRKIKNRIIKNYRRPRINRKLIKTLADHIRLPSIPIVDTSK
jgi:hypothetical protein